MQIFFKSLKLYLFPFFKLEIIFKLVLFPKILAILLRSFELSIIIFKYSSIKIILGVSMINDREEEKLLKKKMEEIRRRFAQKDEYIYENEVEVEASDDNFQEKVIEKSKKIPVLVDFYADWCNSCRMLSPILEKIAKEYNGKFVLAKVNVDDAQITASEFGIMSIPTVILFKNGEPVDYFVGALPESQIREWLKRVL